jgi:hypothetical protein
MATNKKWIETPQALTMLLDDKKWALALDYQRYLDDCENELEDVDESGPLNFDDWSEEYQDDLEFFNSAEFQDEMFRLSEKD